MIMPVTFASTPARTADKLDKKKASVTTGRKSKLRTTSESSSFAQNGRRFKTKKYAVDAKSFVSADDSIEPRKEAARKHRAKLCGRSYSDSHALHEEVLKLYDTEVEVFVMEDENKPRSILKQTSTASSDYYTTNLCDSYELSTCLEMLYSDTVMIESDDSLLSSTSSSHKNSSCDDGSNHDVDAAAAELKRVRFAAKPQLQLFRQNASIAGRTHKNQKKKLAKKKKKNGDSVSDHDDSNHDEANTDTTSKKSSLASSDRRRKRNSSGGSDSGVSTEISSSLSSVSDSLLMSGDDADNVLDEVMYADKNDTAPDSRSTNEVDFVHRALNMLGLGSNSPLRAISNDDSEKKAVHEKINGNGNGNGKDTTVVNGVPARKRRRRRTRNSSQ